MKNNIAKIIGFYGMNIIELSEKSGLSRMTVTNVMNGSNTTKETMSKITTAIGHGLTVDDIFFAQNVILVVQK